MAAGGGGGVPPAVLTWKHLSRTDAGCVLRLCHMGDEEALRAAIEDKVDICGLSRAALPQEPKARPMKDYTREEIARICSGAGLADARLVLKASVDGEAFTAASEDDLMCLLQLKEDKRAALRHVREDKTACDRWAHGESSFARQRVDTLLDLFTAVVDYACTAGFQDERLSALWGIVWTVHETAMTTPLTHHEAYGLALNLIATHAAQVPPFAMQLFSRKQGQRIAEFVHEAYVDVYDMYLHAFTAVPTCRARSVTARETCPAPWGVPAPPAPRALALAMPEAEWIEHSAELAARREEQAAEAAVQAKTVKDAATHQRLADFKSQLGATVDAPMADLESRIRRLEGATREHTVTPADSQAS